MTALTIRNATIADETRWRDLWQQYLVFYKKQLTEEATAYAWKRIIDPALLFRCRLAECDGQVVGFAIYFAHESTWENRMVCYLEDLFVDPAARRGGVGRALIDDIITSAKANNWAHVYWQTDHDNVTARKLYDSYAPSTVVRYLVEVPEIS